MGATDDAVIGRCARSGDRGSTAGGAGDAETRGVSGVCPNAASDGRGAGAGGGIADRGARALGEEADPGTGVGPRSDGSGVGLRAVEGGSGVIRFSPLGGTVDLRDPDGGRGVKRFSDGGIVDLRDDGDCKPDGGSGVMRLSGGGIVDLRGLPGTGVERPAAASSSVASKFSPLRGSTAGVFTLRRDAPRAAPSGREASGGGFPIVTSLTLVEFSQRVRYSRHQTAFSASASSPRE
jgi:hypothetical protein